MKIQIIPKDMIWIVPILVTLFLMKYLILTTKPGLGGFIFLGCIVYFMLFIIIDIIAKQKDINERIKFKPKEKMCYDY